MNNDQIPLVRVLRATLETQEMPNLMRDALIEAFLELLAAARKKHAVEEFDLPARVLAMCHKRGWSLHWTARGAYLHLESSELIEAVRGKRSDPKSEAADVLLVLMSITEHNGIPWAEVVEAATGTCARLETAAPYKHESKEGGE